MDLVGMFQSYVVNTYEASSVSISESLTRFYVLVEIIKAYILELKKLNDRVLHKTLQDNSAWAF